MYNHNAVVSVKTFPQPTSNCFIYALVDPRDNLIRYIGKTSAGFARIRQHYFQVKKELRNKKVNWIKSLKKQNLIFSVLYLKYCSTEDELNIWEKYYIKYYREQGLDLLNHREGGEVTYRPIYTEEMKKRTSETTKLGMSRPEVKERARLTHLGKPSPMKGKQYGEDFRIKIKAANAKRAIKVRDSNGIIYPSLLEASKLVGCTPTDIRRCILDPTKNKKGLFFSRVV